MSVKRISNTRQIFDKTKRQVEESVADARNEAMATMISLVPVLSGFLRDSIETLDEGNRLGIIVLAFYGIFIEYGTFKSGAQPFFRPGLDAGRRKLQTGLKIVK